MSDNDNNAESVENDTVEESKDEAQTEVVLTELELLQKKCDEYLAGWQRAKADYSNLKKETERRRSEMAKFANAAVMAEMLPIFDNFKTAFNHDPKENGDTSEEWTKWQQGIGHIKKQMHDFIGKFGVVEIKTIGEKFDPRLHESIEEEDSESVSSGIIIREVKSGYTLHGELLSPAKVVVAK